MVQYLAREEYSLLYWFFFWGSKIAYMFGFSALIWNWNWHWCFSLDLTHYTICCSHLTFESDWSRLHLCWVLSSPGNIELQAFGLQSLLIFVSTLQNTTAQTPSIFSLYYRTKCRSFYSNIALIHRALCYSLSLNLDTMISNQIGLPYFSMFTFGHNSK